MCVILVTFITTNLVALVAVIVWRLHPALVFLVWLPFILFDGVYLTSSLLKVPDGAWFTLMLATSLAAFFLLWRYGKETQWVCEAKDNTTRLSSLIVPTGAAATTTTTTEPARFGYEGEGQRLTEKYGSHPLLSTPGLGIFLDKSGIFTPKVYEQWLCKFRSQMQVVVLMHLRALNKPHVAEEDRFEVEVVKGLTNVYRLVIRHGYNDHDVMNPGLAGEVVRVVKGEVIREGLVGGREVDINEEEEEEVAVVAKDGEDDDDDDTHDTISPVVHARNHANANPNSTTRKRITRTSPKPITISTSHRLSALEAASSAQTLYLVGKQQMRISASYNIFKKIVLGVFLWVRENSRSKMEKLNVPMERLVEVGFVGEI